MSQENEKKGLFERTDDKASSKVKSAFDEDVRPDDVTTDDDVASEAPAEAAADDAGEAKDPITYSPKAKTTKRTQRPRRTKRRKQRRKRRSKPRQTPLTRWPLK